MNAKELKDLDSFVKTEMMDERLPPLWICNLTQRNWKSSL